MVVHDWELRVSRNDPSLYWLVKVTSHGPYWLQTVWQTPTLYTGRTFPVTIKTLGNNRILDVLYG